MVRLLRAFGSIGFVCLFVSGAMGCKHVCQTKNPYPCEKSPTIAATPTPCATPTTTFEKLHISKGCVKGCVKETPCTVCQKTTPTGQPCLTCNAPLPKLPAENIAEDLKIPSGEQPKTETAQTDNPVSPRDPNAPENLPFPSGFDAPYPLDVPIKGLGNSASLKKDAPLPAQSSTKGHASNYSWLIGEVQYSHISKQWRIRYLGVDQTDDVGGSVALQGADQWLDEINKGGLFRITGQMHKLEKGYVYEVISVKRAN